MFFFQNSPECSQIYRVALVLFPFIVELLSLTLSLQVPKEASIGPRLDGHDRTMRSKDRTNFRGK